MYDITTIGLDTAKSVFQVHGVDGDGEIVRRRQLKRRQVLTFFAKLRPWLAQRPVRLRPLHWPIKLYERPGR